MSLTVMDARQSQNFASVFYCKIENIMPHISCESLFQLLDRLEFVGGETQTCFMVFTIRPWIVKVCRSKVTLLKYVQVEPAQP